MRRRAWLALALVGCASSPAAPVRFVNAPPVTVVDDRRDVPVVPARRKLPWVIAALKAQLVAPIQRLFGMVSASRARGTSSIDEVPDSTWFTNRIGVRTITPDELRTARSSTGNPEAYLPWTIHSTKVGGQNVGFIVSDTRGKKFIIKFDDRGLPEAETAAHMITVRLLWACGYNVTEDYIAYLRRADLVLAPDAVTEDVRRSSIAAGARAVRRR